MTMLDVSHYEHRRGQYLVLIDKAILQKRYRLAVQLANRCLINYYRIFLNSVQPRYKFRRQSAYVIALRLVRYFKKYSKRSSWFSRKDSLYNLLSVSFYLSHNLSSSGEHQHLMFDRVLAEYARNNSQAIAQNLVHYLSELKGK